MKKFTAVLLSLAIVALMIAGFSMSAFAFDEFYDYVTFTATGDDPYAAFKFGNSGKNQSIDPDTVIWAAVRYRTVSEKDTDGVLYHGQFYIMPFVEPCIPIEYKFTGNWETVVVDLLTVSDDTRLDSKWASEFYTTTNKIRFDPLESSRDPEQISDEYDPAVESGAKIDIAWICFFENEEDARAYTGREDTPYCVLGPGALSNLKYEQHNIEVERHKIPTPEPGKETPTPSPSPEPTPTLEVTATPEPTDTPAPTDAPTQTEAPSETDGSGDSGGDTGAKPSDSGDKGCGGVALGGLAIAAAAVFAVVLKKKNEK